MTAHSAGLVSMKKGAAEGAGSEAGNADKWHPQNAGESVRCYCFGL